MGWCLLYCKLLEGDHKTFVLSPEQTGNPFASNCQWVVKISTSPWVVVLVRVVYRGNLASYLSSLVSGVLGLVWCSHSLQEHFKSQPRHKPKFWDGSLLNEEMESSASSRFRNRPRMLICYLCGREFGSKRFLFLFRSFLSFLDLWWLNVEHSIWEIKKSKH